HEIVGNRTLQSRLHVVIQWWQDLHSSNVMRSRDRCVADPEDAGAGPVRPGGVACRVPSGGGESKMSPGSIPPAATFS
ncbi:MAG: hypothetical protein VYC71_03045, partial [Planctomycetota bacterium]|nr:hypothetical protein [Planctomycetota bacterium]